MKEMAREELQANEDMQPQLEEEIKLALVPKDPEEMKQPCLPATYLTCISITVTRKVGR